MNLLAFRLLIVFHLVSTYIFFMFIKDFFLLIFTVQLLLFTLIFLIRIYTVTKSIKEMFKYFIPFYGLKYWKYIIFEEK